ncbi:MAG: hypothetical protein GF310_08325 [candidate division Zixibacteria bacterium]|nr:hypothetical protein [candidate division Zixibacteria bacterium]
MFSLYKFTVVLFALLALASTPSTTAQPLIGDCNSDGYVDIEDAVFIESYLEGSGPLPPPECDCDGFPGVNHADAFQIVGHIFDGASLYEPPGTDLPVPSHVKIFYNKQIDGSPDNQDIPIYIDVPGNTEVEAFIVPFSFASEGGQAELNCDSVSFSGSVVIGAGAGFDNIDKTLVVAMTPADASAVIAGGTSGLLCTAWFSQAALGNDNDLIITNIGRSWPMLLQKEYYEGVDGERIMLPEFIRARYGDVNSDGTANISDAVWIINYVFLGGASPGKMEP